MKYIKSQNTKMIMIAAAMICAILVSSCSFGGGRSKITEFDPYTGTRGITMEFMENSPPDEIFYGVQETEGRDAIATIKLKNEGAYDIREGILVMGYEQDYLALTSGRDEEYFSLDGKTRFKKYGDEATKDFSFLAIYLEPQSETHTTTIMPTICYDYSTKLNDDFCIDVERHVNPETKDKPVCSMSSKSYSSQGAPVAITKVEPRLASTTDRDIVKPQFMIYVKNKGDGQVIDRNKIRKACSSEAMTPEDFNSIYIRATLGDFPLVCKPTKNQGEGYVAYLNLKGEEEDFVRCSLEEGVNINERTHTTVLNIELQYGYTKSISKKMLIRKELI